MDVDRPAPGLWQRFVTHMGFDYGDRSKHRSLSLEPGICQGTVAWYNFSILCRNIVYYGGAIGWCVGWGSFVSIPHQTKNSPVQKTALVTYFATFGGILLLGLGLRLSWRHPALL